MVNNMLPVTVPELEQLGVNWVIFQLRFWMAVQGKGLWGHFDATPASTVSLSPVNSPTILLGTPGKQLEWDCYESTACSLLAQHLPNSTLIVADRQPTVAEMWTEVVMEYIYKGAFSQTKLCCDFLSTCCPKDADVHVFLNELCACRAELNAMGVSINDNDYRSTIIQSLPYSLANFTSSTLAALKLQGITIRPDMLIIAISDEWEWVQST
ncbi:hypothetical protein AN958_12404 [Leucoagaricus sp. SymC.cos]|nr:hypothetical protein AN958_12404 [Leucoagaricus sp. SymC.cos]